jgi:D-threo-aldose 1-dehydrogenase
VARSTEELDQNLAFMRQPIPADLWAELKSVGLLPAEAPTPA